MYFKAKQSTYRILLVGPWAINLLLALPSLHNKSEKHGYQYSFHSQHGLIQNARNRRLILCANVFRHLGITRDVESLV